MPAFRLPITILKGETFRRQHVWKAGIPALPVDITGCSARMQVRSVVDDATVLLELSTANGGIALGGAAGTITLQLSAAATTALTWVRGVYDLEITLSDASVRRLLEGSVKVKPEVTR